MALLLTDQTANGNDLTNVNTVAEYTASLPFATNNTRAAGFTAASSQYFTAADSASLSITGNITLECWVNFATLPSAGNGMSFMGKFDAGGNVRSYYFETREDSGQKLRFAYSTDGTFQAANDLRVAWTPSTDTWYHVAVSWTALSAVAKFFVDGAQQGSDQTGSGTSIANTTSLLTIGALDSGSPSTFLNGREDDNRVWNIARTEAAISADKSTELTGTESGLVAYWPYETAAPVVVSTTVRGYSLFL